MSGVVRGSHAISRPVSKRSTVRAFAGETATQALREAGWGSGRECFGFNKGQFSFVDLIEAVGNWTGPAHATIATWTAATADMSRIESWLKRQALLSVTWLVDYSFETRQPAFCSVLRETFGDDCIRTTASHAKFVLMKADGWGVIIQSSMNLNQNKRLENFWIADDPDLFEAYSGLVSEVFGVQGPGEGFGEKPTVRRAEFGALGEGRKSSLFDVRKGTDLLL
ncbi:MAG: hypothetical protein R3D70_09425 [Rhizobiaceae bacterium]